MKPALMGSRSVGLERMAISVLAAVFLVVFRQNVPHGDALRIVSQIESGQLRWNPNHLLFDPIGYALFGLLQKTGLAISALGTFELISGVSTIAALSIFHAILCQIGVKKASVRVLAAAGLFSSASFLAVSVSQYYFMVQMPFLLGAIYCYFILLSPGAGPARAGRAAFAVGALLAIATSIMFSNILLIVVTALLMMVTPPRQDRSNIPDAIRLLTAAGAIGLPVFLAGWALSNSSTDVLTWVLSYEGKEASGLNDFYGLKWTLSGVVQGLSMVGFNLLLGSLVDSAGFGTVLSILAFGQQFEFIPQWHRIILAMTAVPLVVVMNCGVFVFALRCFRTEPAIRFLVGWIGALVTFNLLWNVGDEIFWFQIVPAIWLILLAWQGDVGPEFVASKLNVLGRLPPNTLSLALAVTVGILLLVNTANAVAPGADRDFEHKKQQHADLFRDGDMEVLPGWDRQKWFSVGAGGPVVERVVLMDLALSGRGPNGMETLPRRVEEVLRRGHRVIVARLYEPDEDLMPWYALRDMGWPRSRIKNLLGEFCVHRVSVIGGIAFDELKSCDRADAQHNAR